MNPLLQVEETAQDGVESLHRESALPTVSVIMPVLNEERFIERSLGAVLQQDYPGHLVEVIVADGMSTDRTRERIKSLQAKHPNVRLIDNPGRIASTGLNRALEVATSKIVIRLDGHCEYPRDYIRQLVTLREQFSADNIGGILEPCGSTYVQRSIGVAFHSPVGLGGAALRASTGPALVKQVDAVHGGCWERERLRAVGGFDEQMVRNQDDELSFRLRKSDGKIFQSTALRVKYHVRESFRKLFIQFAQYGYWKVRVVRKHPQQASLRHFIPALFICSVLMAMAFSPFSSMGLWLLAGILGVYGLGIGTATLVALFPTRLGLWPGTMLALSTMHAGYGLGFAVGWLRILLGPLPTDRVFERISR